MYAHDIGPAQNLGLVAVEALRQGHRVHFTGNQEKKEPLLDDRPDVVVTGLSSRELQGNSELKMGALAKGAIIPRVIPWVVLADTHRSWGREFARGKVDGATLLVAAPGEEDDARRFGYTDVKYLGGPPIWQDFAETKPAKVERQDPEDKLIMVVGNKDARVIDDMCFSVIQACRDLFGNKWGLIFKPHPNEDPNTKNSATREEILAKARTILNTPARTTNLIPAVDCSVFYPGATDSVAAAYMRRPAVCYENERSLAQLKAATGVEDWFPAASGACIEATHGTIREAIERAVSPDGAAELRKRQEQVYPNVGVEGERAESRIVKFLAELAKTS